MWSKIIVTSEKAIVSTTINWANQWWERPRQYFYRDIFNFCDLKAMAGEHHAATLKAHKSSKKQPFWKIP